MDIIINIQENKPDIVLERPHALIGYLIGHSPLLESPGWACRADQRAASLEINSFMRDGQLVARWSKSSVAMTVLSAPGVLRN